MPSGSTTLLPGGFAVKAPFALSAATGHHRSQTMLESPAERPEEQRLFEAWQKKVFSQVSMTALIRGCAWRWSAVASERI